MQFLRNNKIALGIFVLALLARGIYLGLSLHASGGDLNRAISGADCYNVISNNILAGNGYSCDLAAPYTLNSIRPPVFPYFLAAGHALVGSYWLPLFIQMVLSSLVPLLGMVIASYFLSRRASAWVGVLLALEPNGLLYSTIFYSEGLFTFLFLASFVLFIHFLKKEGTLSLYASAVLLGLATLTKPTSEYVAVLYVLALLWHFRIRLKSFLMPAVLFVVLFVLTLSPWLYRNHYHFGVAGISPQAGEQMYAILVPSVLSFERGTSFSQEFDTIIAEGGGADPNQASIEHGSEYMHKALPILLAHPKSLTLVSLNTALNFYIHDGMIEVLKHVGVRPAQKLGKPALFLLLSDPLRLFHYIGGVFMTPLILIFFGRIAWVAMTVWAVAGVWLYMRKERERVCGVLLSSIVFYFMLTTLVVGLGVTARFRVPVNALIFIFAVYGAGVVYHTYRKKRVPVSAAIAKNFKKLSIIIPAYNEEKTIAEIVARVKAAPLSLEKEIIVVDNNSKDKTFAIASSIPGVRVLKETAKGKGAAVKCGVAQSTGDIVLFQDADLEYDPRDYPAVLEPILAGHTDVVLGVRIEERHGDFLIYYFGWLGNHTITWLTNILYWHNAGEYEGCYKAFTREVIQSVTVETNNFDYDNELVCKLLKRGHCMVDVPIHYYPRNYDEGKKINWRHGFLILWTIIRVRFRG